MRTKAITLFSILFAVTAGAQKFTRHKIKFWANDSKPNTVNVRPAVPFGIKRLDDYSWVMFEKGEGEVTFRVKENLSGRERRCRFVLYDLDGYPVDTLIIKQASVTRY